MARNTAGLQKRLWPVVMRRMIPARVLVHRICLFDHTILSRVAIVTSRIFMECYKLQKYEFSKKIRVHVIMVRII